MNNFTEMIQKYFGSTGEKLQQMSEYAENHAKIEAKESLHRILDKSDKFSTLVSRYHIDRSSQSLVIQSRFKILN